MRTPKEIASIFVVLFMTTSSLPCVGQTGTQSNVQGVCNVALGVNNGRVEVNCANHKAELQKIQGDISRVQQSQKLNADQLDSLVLTVNRLVGKLTSRSGSRLDPALPELSRLIEDFSAKNAAAIEIEGRALRDRFDRVEQQLRQMQDRPEGPAASNALSRLDIASAERIVRSLDEIREKIDELPRGAFRENQALLESARREAEDGIRRIEMLGAPTKCKPGWDSALALKASADQYLEKGNSETAGATYRAAFQRTLEVGTYLQTVQGIERSIAQLAALRAKSNLPPGAPDIPAHYLRQARESPAGQACN